MERVVVDFSITHIRPSDGITVLWLSGIYQLNVTIDLCDRADRRAGNRNVGLCHLYRYYAHVSVWTDTLQLALGMGRGVPPALSKPDPVVICLMAQKTTCLNLKKKHWYEFNWLVYGVIITNLFRVLMVFSSSLLFCSEKLRLPAMRLGNSDGIRMQTAWETGKKTCQSGWKLKKAPLCQFWKLKKDTLCQS